MDIYSPHLQWTSTPSTPCVIRRNLDRYSAWFLVSLFFWVCRSWLPYAFRGQTHKLTKALWSVLLFDFMTSHSTLCSSSPATLLFFLFLRLIQVHSHFRALHFCGSLFLVYSAHQNWHVGIFLSFRALLKCYFSEVNSSSIFF